jgi:ribonuclease BN (tRNA processing enzyme)
VLVHISPRYTEEDLEKFIDAAKQHSGNTEIGSDLQQFMIPYRDEDPNLPRKT